MRIEIPVLLYATIEDDEVEELIASIANYDYQLNAKSKSAIPVHSEDGLSLTED